MKTKKDMSENEQYQAQVTFKDVAAYFSEKEWKLLHEWQKELYKNVMKEIHRALISLGYQIVNPDTLLRISKGEEVNIRDPERRLGISDSTASWYPAINPDILLRIKPEEEVRGRVQRGSVESAIDKCPNAGHAVIKSVVSLIIKEERETCSMDDDDSESGDNGNSAEEHVITMVESASIKEEVEETLYIDHMGYERREFITNPTDCGIASRKQRDGRTEKRTPCKASSGKAISEVSDNGGKSKIQLWPESNISLRGEETFQCERGVGYPVSPSLHAGAHKTERLDTYSECQRNTDILPCQPKMQTSCKPCANTEYQKRVGHNTDLIAPETTTGEIPHCAQFDRGVKSNEPADCEKTFDQKSKQDKQQKTHIGERSFICAECNKIFRHKDSLVKHQRTHTGERPYQCTDCEKGFARKESLIIHNRTHTGERPFTCTECDLGFINKGNLITHQRTHTGDKPYHCSECRKSFSVKIGLIRHKRTHTGEKPYNCTECDKSFSQKQNLIKHQRTHTGEKPYQCYECDKCFSEKISLFRHHRTHSEMTNTP